LGEEKGRRRDAEATSCCTRA